MKNLPQPKILQSRIEILEEKVELLYKTLNGLIDEYAKTRHELRRLVNNNSQND